MLIAYVHTGLFLDINMIGFTIFVMVVFETYKWWKKDGKYTYYYEYSLFAFGCEKELNFKH